MSKKALTQSKPVSSSGFYGWVIVGIAALGLFFSGPGQTYSVSIFINSYVEDFGWSRSQVSSYYSMATLLAGLLLPLIGRAIDAAGHRRLITIISTLLGMTCLWMSFINQPMMLFIGFIMLRLFGQGSMTLIPSTLVPQWFVRHRGKALSLMAIGGVVGSGLLPPLNNWLITYMGAGFAWRVWAVLLIGVMAPLGWHFVRNQPEDMGEVPDGNKQLEDENSDLRYVTRISTSEISWTLKEAMKTRAFWFMLFCMVVPSMINTGITFHMVSIMETKGFSSSFAAWILSIVAMTQFPLTFVAGYVVDKVKIRYVKGVNFVVFLGAMAMLLYSQSNYSLVIYAVVHGIFVAFDSVSTGVLWPNYFGKKNLGSIRGFAMTAMVIGSALGPLPFGYAYDLFNGYWEILLLMMTFPILASVAALLSPAPKYKEENAKIDSNI
ncbi:major facilitator superfamily MFS_1 [Alkaliphilus metalliredigens QYMF]|uniref:Major facilitator superfamily MFS_1 n=1 Tax=Alkaliphilus metalliredigens (strain QYMF) TaxID=293826 RepID=A6TM08_ALKMQ|nr:MFS transporter [Alkaliphilus metalliredigens]ABR47226.1 major facilitator superfamily MFS_1 [Alkaliphilus metalliredigens QYMF]